MTPEERYGLITTNLHKIEYDEPTVYEDPEEHEDTNINDEDDDTDQEQGTIRLVRRPRRELTTTHVSSHDLSFN